MIIEAKYVNKQDHAVFTAISSVQLSHEDLAELQTSLGKDVRGYGMPMMIQEAVIELGYRANEPAWSYKWRCGSCD